MKTYTNQAYGFSFDYPNSLEIEETGGNMIRIWEEDSYARLEIVKTNLFESPEFKKYQNPSFIDFAEYAAGANYGSVGPTGVIYLDGVEKSSSTINLNGVRVFTLFLKRISKHWPNGLVLQERVTEKTFGPVYAIDAGNASNVRLLLIFPDDYPNRSLAVKTLKPILESLRF